MREFSSLESVNYEAERRVEHKSGEHREPSEQREDAKKVENVAYRGIGASHNEISCILKKKTYWRSLSSMTSGSKRQQADAP